MAMVAQRGDYHIRLAKKEPEWSSICNSVFDQYLDSNDPFGIGLEPRERSSFDDSDRLFEFSASSEQSMQTSDTSPILSWAAVDEGLAVAATGAVLADARQPRPKEPADFWSRKLQALEQNAAAHEDRQQKLRASKSHADFLSVGGYPSPPVLPPSPTDQASSVQARKTRTSANGRKTPTRRCVTVRSISRGRAVGVTKLPPSAAAVAAVNPYATIRKCHGASPGKMMNPSQYRAGFKDAWAQRIDCSPKKYELHVPSLQQQQQQQQQQRQQQQQQQQQQPFPASPPPSARAYPDDFAAFGGSPTVCCGLPIDDQISPLANTFHQQARIHTPIASPLLGPAGGEYPATTAHYIDVLPPSSLHSGGNLYRSTATTTTTTAAAAAAAVAAITAGQTVSLNDTAPLYSEPASPAVAERIQNFDFGFSPSPADLDQWHGAHQFAESFPPSYPVTATAASVRRGGSETAIDRIALPGSDYYHHHHVDLGAAYDANMAVATAGYQPHVSDAAFISGTAYQTLLGEPTTYYLDSSSAVMPHGLPATPPEHLSHEDHSGQYPYPQSHHQHPHHHHPRSGSSSSSPPRTEHGGGSGHGSGRTHANGRRGSQPRKCSSSTSRHRRTKSSSAATAHSSGTPRSGGNSNNNTTTTTNNSGSGALNHGGHHGGLERGGFVNFTPQDSGKILNGVAPSGSSKTKARREKEAADKRRRLSQAAVRAIVEAGGDPAALTEAGVML